MSELYPFAVTYAVKQKRGGVMVVEQTIIQSRSYEDAIRKACHQCKRGEFVHSVEAIKDDLDLLDYNDMEVI
jgi:hypothetical protein